MRRPVFSPEKSIAPLHRQQDDCQLLAPATPVHHSRPSQSSLDAIGEDQHTQHTHQTHQALESGDWDSQRPCLCCVCVHRACPIHQFPNPTVARFFSPLPTPPLPRLPSPSPSPSCEPHTAFFPPPKKSTPSVAICQLPLALTPPAADHFPPTPAPGPHHLPRAVPRSYDTPFFSVACLLFLLHLVSAPLHANASCVLLRQTHTTQTHHPDFKPTQLKTAAILGVDHHALRLLAQLAPSVCAPPRKHACNLPCKNSIHPFIHSPSLPACHPVPLQPPPTIASQLAYSSPITSRDRPVWRLRRRCPMAMGP